MSDNIRLEDSLDLRVSDLSDHPAQQVAERQQRVQAVRSAQLTDLFTHQLPLDSVTRKNCENMVGAVEIPVGVAGPLTIDWGEVKEDVLVPLATTEGALVASVNRGCKALTQAGGVQVAVEYAGMTRSPVFECLTGRDALKFRDWFLDHTEQIQDVVVSTSKHIKLLDVQTWVRGKLVFVRFAFDTDQAMGMNMVTIALQKALAEALERHPEIRLVSLSSNVCTDKKDSVLNSVLGRGYWVQAEAVLSAKVLREVLKTDAASLEKVHRHKNLIGSNLAGSFSQNAHVANVVAALYLATGQDPAHVVEGSKAFLTVELLEKGDVYCALTLPNIQVGVVGGGTYLPRQSQARQLISNRDLLAHELAGVVGAAALAGEISLIAALGEQKLAYAHQMLGRAC